MLLEDGVRHYYTLGVLNNYYNNHKVSLKPKSMVLKTGPDWSVQLLTGVLSGSVLWKNQKFGKNGQKPKTDSSTVKTAN
jgi:hypothetical protein